MTQIERSYHTVDKNDREHTVSKTGVGSTQVICVDARAAPQAQGWTAIKAVKPVKSSAILDRKVGPRCEKRPLVGCGLFWSTMTIELKSLQAQPHATINRVA